MKLNEIKQSQVGEVDLMEGVIPINISMLLEKVIRDGKVTNNVQHFIIAGLIEMFKNGGQHRWTRDINDYSMQSSADMIEEVKAFSPENAVSISEWLLNRLAGLAAFESDPFTKSSFNPNMGTEEWLRFVTQKQD